MISIEEMRAYKDMIDTEKERRKTAHINEIKSLENTIEELYRDDVVEMVEYGKVAVECGLMHEYDNIDAHRTDATVALTEKTNVYSEPYQYQTATVRCVECRNVGYVVDCYHKIYGVGICEGGGYDLSVSPNGDFLRISWHKHGYNTTHRDKYFDEKYEKALRKFIKDFGTWKARVLALVASNMNKGE